jgi:hypothetical protein
VLFRTSEDVGYDVPPLLLLLALIHRSAWNRNSRKFISKILHSPAPIPLESPTPDTPHGPAPLALVTPMDRYAGLWMMEFLMYADSHPSSLYIRNSRKPKNLER